MALYRIVLFSLAIVYSARESVALKCYECIDSKVETTGLLSTLWHAETQSDPDCEYAPLTSISRLNTRTCAEGEVCGVIRGSVSYLLAKSSTVARSCVPQSARGSDGCVPGLSEATKILSIFTSEEGLGFDGDVCFCTTSMCSAGPCGDDMVKVFGYCMQPWLVAVAVLVMIVLLLLLTCCCCCCCCCCRSKRQPVVAVCHTSGGGHECSNLMYGEASGQHVPNQVWVK